MVMSFDLYTSKLPLAVVPLQLVLLYAFFSIGTATVQRFSKIFLKIATVIRKSQQGFRAFAADKKL